jgi:hypothetical protein
LEKTNTLKNIMQRDGEITKAFIAAVKAHEALLNNQETSKTKKASISKEATAACYYWANNRKSWIEEGHEQGIKAFNASADKSKAFNEKQESKALNKAVRAPNYYDNPLLTTVTVQPPSSPGQSWPLQSWPLQSTQPTNQIHSISYQSPTPLPPYAISTPAHELSARTDANEEHALQRKRNRRQRNWERQRKKIHGSTVKIPSNRRINKKSLLKKKLHDKNLILKYLEEIKSLHKIGVAIPEVHNISTKEIPNDLLEPLALGHKFIHAPKINYSCIKDSIEYFTRSVRLKWHFRNEEEDSENSEISKYWIPKKWTPTKQQSHSTIEKSLQQLHLKLKHCKPSPFQNISKTHLNNLKQLLSDPELMIVTADKNLGYTITDTEWYKNACLEHLTSNSYINVTNEYYKDDFGKTTKETLYRTICDKITSALEEDLITDEEAIWICQEENFMPSKFYITPKIHKKPPFKGRPIVPSMSWITFHLSEWVSNQLNPLVNNICTDVLKDSTQLLQDINELNTQGINTSQYQLLSADVESLYPNMDVNFGLTLMKDFLNEIQWEDTTKRELLLWAMHTILTQGYIYFNEQIYQQTNGAAMGSPMIPPYANCFLHMIERDLVQKHKDSKLLLLYKRYIDDVLIIIEKKPNQIAELQAEFNNLHHKIKLTWTEPSSQTDFLDITIVLDHKKSTIETLTFQKALNKYSYLPYHSFHTPSMKTGFIKGEAIRYAKSCSRKKDFNRMISLFTIRLQRRGYPLNLIKSTLKSIQYSKRHSYLNTRKNKKNTIPFIFKILYNHITPHHLLRQCLDEFSDQLKSNIADLPSTLKQKITICYQLPNTLHTKVLKARKDRGF